jgi:ATP-binding cassette subfamily F protein uup
LATKRAREAGQKASEEKRQNFLRNEAIWIQRGPKARGTKQKARTERFYEVLEQTPEEASEMLELSFAKTRLGRFVIRLNAVSKGYAGQSVIEDFQYIVSKTDRIGIIGPNGSGKSTLLKLMAGRLEPDSGTIEMGTTVKIGYFSQEHEDMDESIRVLESIREAAEFIETGDGQKISASQMLERFFFSGSLQWTPIAKLSGGEKRRLALLRVLMSAPNVLLLDEPTNDLDIPTLHVLEDYLNDFPGAVIVVSHDRYFLDRVVEKVFALSRDGGMTQVVGNFSTYLEKQLGSAGVNQGQPFQGSSQVSQTGSNGLSGSIDSHANGTADGKAVGGVRVRAIPKFTFKEQKEFAEIDEKIANLEQILQTVDEQMKAVASDYTHLQDLYGKRQQLETQLNELVDRWAYLNEIEEAMERSRRT